jgi:hypothetical protein
MKPKQGLSEVFRVFQNTESYFDERNQDQSTKLILKQILIICLFTFLYGVVMGSYHSLIQSLSAGIKVTFLFLCTILICFPSFFIIQQVLGSKMTIRQMLLVVMSGFVLTSAIAFSFAPIIILFQLTGGNYHFLQLLHVAIFIFSGFFGMKLMIEALKYACEKKDIYPQTGVTVFRVWIIIMAFVGIQLAWNLRPFLCNKNEEFKLFRKYEGNFYTAIVYSAQQLATNHKGEGVPDEHSKPVAPHDTVRESKNDSVLYNLLKD